MIITAFNSQNIPDWAFEEMSKQCPYCGGYIAQNENLTARWCVNPKCPRHMAYRLDDLAKHFGIKGIGPETAYTLIKERKFQSHFEIMKYWYPAEKPIAHLYDIVGLAAIDGYGLTQAQRDLANYASFEEYFATASHVQPLLLANKEMLIDAQKYFTLLPPLSADYINVMATGSFDGYRSRDQYFQIVNILFGDRLHIINCGKRKTEVSFLIKEPHADDREKSRIAAERGIPVVTPKQFILILCAYLHISLEDISRKVEELKG